MKTGFSKVIWGIFLLLAAAFVLTNQLGGFADLGIGSIIAAVLSFILIVHCIAYLNFALLPLPLAVLYIVFQAPLELPYIKHPTLIAASVLAFIGLSFILPNHRYHGHHQHHRHIHSSHSENHQAQTENGSNDNNPSVSVHFGTVSKRLHADSLETANLQCSFGALEVFFDHVELSPNGAEAVISCNFGAIELLIPKHWRIINHLTCTLGGVGDHGISSAGENAPQLTLTGSVSFGGVEVKYI